MHKKGVSGLEFILAFALFVGFTISAFYFFNPIQSLKDMDHSLDYTLNEIIKNASVELESYSIVTGTNLETTVIIEGIDSKNVSAVNYEGVRIDASGSGEKFCFERNTGDKGFVTLYFSEDIDKSDVLSCGDEDEDYDVASSSKDRVISEKRMLLLNKSYNSDYPSLKEQLGIPANVDFSFSLEFPDKNISAGSPDGKILREIFSKSNRKEVLRTNGVPQFGQLTVRVW